MSPLDRDNAASTCFEGGNPIFRVRDLAASVDYYVRLLGFTLDWEETGVASVSRGRVTLFLCEGDQGNPGAWAWIGVGDADALHKEYRAVGAKVRHPPTSYSWALEMQVEDLDENVLRLGSAPIADCAVGAWLDMHGNAWVQTPDGSWTRDESS